MSSLSASISSDEPEINFENYIQVGKNYLTIGEWKRIKSRIPAGRPSHGNSRRG